MAAQKLATVTDINSIVFNLLAKTLCNQDFDLKLLSNSAEVYRMNHEISLTGSKVRLGWKGALHALSDNTW
jgi:hypothetical protein